MAEKSKKGGAGKYEFVEADLDFKITNEIADMVKMGEKVIANETIMQYAVVSKENPVFESGEEKNWENTNKLVDPTSPYYCSFATGLKTGQTPSAGSCLLSSFDYAGKQYIIGVFGCPEIEDRFVDTLQLLKQTVGG